MPPIVVMASEQVPCGGRGMVKVSTSLASLIVTVERSTERLPIVMEAMMAVEREIFANLFGIYSENNYAVVDFVEKYFPNTTTRFKKSLETI